MLINTNGFNESGNNIIFGFGSFGKPSDNRWEDRLALLDDKTRDVVRKHLDEIQTDEQLEMFINQYQRGELRSDADLE